MTDPRSSVRLSNTDRANALRNAIIELDWLLDLKHPRYQWALDWVGDTATQSQVVTSDYERVGSKPKGTISDPTGEAVVKSVELGGRRVSLTERATQRTRDLTHLAAVIGESSGFIVDTVRATLHDVALDHPPMKLDQAHRALEFAAKVGAHGHRANETAKQLRQCDRLEEASEFDHAIRLVDESCRSLAQMCGTFLRERAFTEEAPKPQQKPLVGCVSCKRDDGYYEPIDTEHHNARQMCRVCGDYASAEGEWLPLGAVQYRHRTGKRLTVNIIDKAKANDRKRHTAHQTKETA